MESITDLITTSEGAKLTGYAAPYVRQLARTGRIVAMKLGRDWLVSREALLSFKNQMDALGASKYNPSRHHDNVIGYRASVAGKSTNAPPINRQNEQPVNNMSTDNENN